MKGWYLYMVRLNLSINKDLKESYYIQIYKQIKKQILNTTIKEGDKLPSIRQVAIKLDINQNTVIQSYHLLEEKGFINKISGKGCFVAKISDFKIEQKEIALIESFKYGQKEKNGIDFYNGTPAYEYFPIKQFEQFTKEVISECGGEIFQYQSVQGVDSLREILAEDLERDGIFVTKDRIQITSGTQQALDIIIKLFTKDRKPTVVLSSPTYPNALNIFKDCCNIKDMDIKKDGWDLDEFEKLLKEEKIDFIYEVINYQNPTGVIWSLEKRERLLKLSKEYNFYIIEDDSFSEFYYTDEKPELLKSLDKIGEEKIIYIKTFSKILMPGIGLALMVVPENLLENILLVKYGLDTTTSGLNQKILEKFIKTKELENHLLNIREIFKKKKELMFELLKRIQNLEIMHIPEGGFFIWVKLADCIDGEKFYKECKENGVFLLPGSVFYSDRRDACKIRLSFISPSLKEIIKGIGIIEHLLLLSVIENSKTCGN